MKKFPCLPGQVDSLEYSCASVAIKNMSILK